jgi:hypothetical protein
MRVLKHTTYIYFVFYIIAIDSVLCDRVFYASRRLPFLDCKNVLIRVNDAIFVRIVNARHKI